MIGIWQQHAQNYLLILFAFTTLAFAIPLTFFPLTWARLMQWRVPDDVHLSLYFGRCLGCFALIVEALMLRAAMHGTAIHTVFEILTVFFSMMVVLHVVGWWQKVQPWTETAEIIFWVVLVLLTLACFPQP